MVVNAMNKGSDTIDDDYIEAKNGSDCSIILQLGHFEVNANFSDE